MRLVFLSLLSEVLVPHRSQVVNLHQRIDYGMTRAAVTIRSATNTPNNSHERRDISGFFHSQTNQIEKKKKKIHFIPGGPAARDEQVALDIYVADAARMRFDAVLHAQSTRIAQGQLSIDAGTGYQPLPLAYCHRAVRRGHLKPEYQYRNANRNVSKSRKSTTLCSIPP